MSTPARRSFFRCSIVALTLMLAGAASLAQPVAAPAQPVTDAAVATPKDQPGEGQRAKANKRPSIYDETADAKQQIAEAVAKAAKNNRRVLVQWGGNWCGWCILLHDKMASDSTLKKELLYEYDVVLVDIGNWDKHMDLAQSYGADLKGNGVPYLTVLGADGKAIANQETGSLEAKQTDGQNGHDAAKVLSFLKKHEAAPHSAEESLSQSLAKAKSENKMVFLHFGAPWCGWCHPLENWMAKPEVADILGKDFIDLKIDTDRDTGGKDALKKYAKTDGGIPWFVFLSADGAPIVTSDGPKGNVGFPAAPEEIEHFVSMLTNAKKSMTAEDVQTLKTSLEMGKK
ncbi:MAG: thioredoxin family protein [Phycisphaerales bacterium]|nr:thioredoxin family protein [Phycisphaerales bacterium]